MLKRMPRKKLIAGAVAAAALAGGGAAIAATQLGSEATEQAILDDAAERLGVEPSELSEALRQAYLAQVDAGVAAGDLTEEQGEALKERVEAGDVPLVGVPRFGGHGPGSQGPGFPGPGLSGPRFPGLDAASDYLGLTRDELRAELESGKTLAEVATDNGKSVDGLKDALLGGAEERLDADVEAGRLSQERAQEILERLCEHVDDLVNGELPRGPGHRFHGHGADGPGSGSEPSEQGSSEQGSTA